MEAVIVITPGSTAPAGDEQANGRRFRRRSWSPGYSAPEVDALIERIEATLAGTAGPDRAVTAADARAARFGTTRRGGYDPSMVDQTLAAYAQQLEPGQG